MSHVWYDDETLFHNMIQCDHVVLFWNAAANLFNLKLPLLQPVTFFLTLKAVGEAPTMIY